MESIIEAHAEESPQPVRKLQQGFAVEAMNAGLSDQYIVEHRLGSANVVKEMSPSIVLGSAGIDDTAGPSLIVLREAVEFLETIRFAIWEFPDLVEADGVSPEH